MKNLEVRYHINEDNPLKVGTLAQGGKKTLFEYDEEFLKTGHPLSPFHLPLRKGVFDFRDYNFGNMFGLFYDSLPDGWGLLLMDRAMRKKNMDLSSVISIDRLAFIGDSAMGALSYHPFIDGNDQENLLLDLRSIAEEIERVWEGQVEEVLPQLMRSGGSPGGARPKILAAINGNELITCSKAPENFEHWLIKFASPNENPHSCIAEYIYSQLTAEAGMTMSETRLFESEAGFHFGTKRFDRKGNQRIHCQTLGSLIHSDFRLPSCDYDDLMKVTRALTKSAPDLEAVFRQAVFNVASHNRDDHVKNFSFIYSPERKWRLSPAYDIAFNYGPGGEHSMSVCGEGRNISRKHLLQLAEKHSIPTNKATSIIDEVIAAVRKWPKKAKEFDLDKKLSKEIWNAIDSSTQKLSK